jgi:hypothetical protein
MNFTVRPTGIPELDRVQYSIASAFGSLQTAISQVAGAASRALTPGQIVFGGGDGRTAQSSDLAFTTAGGITAIELRTMAVPTAFAVLRALDTLGARIAQLIFVDGANFHAMTLSVAQSGAGNEDQVVASGVGAGGQPPLIVWTQNKDVAIGDSATIAAAATRGFVYIPAITGPPTGVPTLAGGAVTGSRVPVGGFDVATGKLWAYYAGAWHWSQFT